MEPSLGRVAGSLHPYSFLPSLPHTGQTFIVVQRLSHPPRVPFPFSLTGIFPNKPLAHLIPFWHLRLGEPERT